MKNKTLRTKKVRNFTVSLVEYQQFPGSFWKYWRVEVKAPGSVTSAPYDDYEVALLAWKDRVNDISVFG